MQHYQGKKILLTGASSGLGKSILACLSTVSDCKIVACSRNIEQLRDYLSQIHPVASVEVMSIDLESSDAEILNAVTKCFRVFDGIDMLINCAGLGFRGCIAVAN